MPPHLNNLMERRLTTRGVGHGFRADAWLFVVSMVAVGAVGAQTYPPSGYPGGYPPGSYPGGTGAGIPVPRRSKPQADGTKGQPLPNFRGKLKTMDAKAIVIAMSDATEMQFRRTDKTKFYKNGDEVKNPQFAAGDQVSVEGPEETGGGMLAVNVYWEKGAGSSSAGATDTAKKDDGAYDTWKDAPKQEHTTEMAPPPAKRDADDPGPPTLQRGKVADPSREHMADAPPSGSSGTTSGSVVPPSLPPRQEAANTASSGNPPAPYRDDDAAPPRRDEDDLIRRATDAAFDFTQNLPDYVCQEIMTRYQSETRPASWQPIDRVEASVIYDNGQESYRNIQINGRPITKKMEEMGGAWSTGEFGTILINLFSPYTAAQFHLRGSSRAAGITAKLYDFTVDHEHSHWHIQMPAQSYEPGYRGSVWIDPQTARVLRIEMQAVGFPSNFPIDHVESATDYEYVRLGDAQQYLLPVHSENIACDRGTSNCSHNIIDFRNYHKYTGESSIKFGDVKQ